MLLLNMVGKKRSMLNNLLLSPAYFKKIINTKAVQADF